MNRQEELLTGDGEYAGDDRAEGSSGVGDREQAEMSLMSDVHGSGSGSCWSQMHIYIFENSKLES